MPGPSVPLGPKGGGLAWPLELADPAEPLEPPEPAAPAEEGDAEREGEGGAPVAELLAAPAEEADVGLDVTGVIVGVTTGGAAAVASTTTGAPA